MEGRRKYIMCGLFSPRNARPCFVGITPEDVLQQSWYVDGGGMPYADWVRQLWHMGWNIRVVLLQTDTVKLDYLKYAKD